MDCPHTWKGNLPCPKPLGVGPCIYYRLQGCYVLGLTQGAFFILHLLTKPFPSHDQPPIHLDHMTSHLTTHMTSHMPFQSPAPQSHLSYITCSQVTCASPDTPSPDLTWPYPYPWLVSICLPIPTPDLSLFAYLSLASGFSARLLYFLHSLVLRLILTPFLLPSRVSQFHSIWLHLLGYDSLLVQVLVVLCLSYTASSHVYKPSCFPRVGP